MREREERERQRECVCVCVCVCVCLCEIPRNIRQKLQWPADCLSLSSYE